MIEKEKISSRPDGPSRRDQGKQSIMEKQVSNFRRRLSKNYPLFLIFKNSH